MRICRGGTVAGLVGGSASEYLQMVVHTFAPFGLKEEHDNLKTTKGIVFRGTRKANSFTSLRKSIVFGLLRTTNL